MKQKIESIFQQTFFTWNKKKLSQISSSDVW